MRFNLMFGILMISLISFSSAGFFGDVFGSITGSVVSEEGMKGEFLIKDTDCGEAKEIVEEKYLGYEIPGGVPFSNDIFDIYVDSIFFASFELKDKKIQGISCEASADVDYNVYVTESLVEEANLGVDDFIGFYEDKKKSGELEIKAVGFVKKVKLGFVNFGLKVASWFG